MIPNTFLSSFLSVLLLLLYSVPELSRSVPGDAGMSKSVSKYLSTLVRVRVCVWVGWVRGRRGGLLFFPPSAFVANTHSL